MKLRSVALFCRSCLPLAVLVAANVQADELPDRKAGLWELKMFVPGTPETTSRQCIDAAFEKEMKGMFASLGGEKVCSKLDTKKTSTGYVVDAVCESYDITTTSRTEFIGDFNSAYVMKQTWSVQAKGGGKGKAKTMMVQAKWLGACPADWKPGDVEMPGGHRVNAKDVAE